MICRSTWILLVLLVALVGFAFYLTDRKAKQQASTTPTAAPGSASSSAVLFSSAEGTPSDIKLQDLTGKSVDVARNESGVWVLKAPTDAPADQASAEAAATQVSSLRVLSSVQLGFDIVGLDKPSYTAKLTFSGGKTHALAIGAQTPIQDGYYTSLDGGPVRIVDKQGIDALLQLLTQPPYVATLTPAVTATETAAAVTATPAASDTPSAATAPAATSTP